MKLHFTKKTQALFSRRHFITLIFHFLARNWLKTNFLTLDVISEEKTPVRQISEKLRQYAFGTLCRSKWKCSNTCVLVHLCFKLEIITIFCRTQKICLNYDITSWKLIVQTGPCLGYPCPTNLTTRLKQHPSEVIQVLRPV